MQWGRGAGMVILTPLYCSKVQYSTVTHTKKYLVLANQPRQEGNGPRCKSARNLTHQTGSIYQTSAVASEAKPWYLDIRNMLPCSGDIVHVGLFDVMNTNCFTVNLAQML